MLHSEHFDTKYAYVVYRGDVEINQIMSRMRNALKIAP